MLQPLKFPSAVERERLGTLKNYQKLYDNEQYAVLGLHEIIKKQYKKLADLVYLSHAIPARVTEFYGDFVSGDVDRMIIQAGTGVKEEEDFVEQTVFESDLKEKMFDIASSQSEFGFSVLLGRMDEEQTFIIDEVGVDQYFPQKDGSVVFATYKLDPSDSSGKRLLLYTQHYHMNETGDAVVIDRQAWTTNDDGVGEAPYPLTSMAELLGKDTIEATTTIENLDELPIRQIDNGKRTKWGFGKSDYADIMPQLAEVNERSTQISTQFLKNLNAKLVVPSNMLDEDDKLPDGDTYAMESKEDVTPTYITNTNSMISDAREHIVQEAKFISFVTGVPMFEILKSAMPERVESLRIQLFSAIRKTHRKRSKVSRAIKDMIRIGFKMAGKEFDTDPKIVFGDVLPIDENMEANTEATKVGAGLSSHISSIMRLENLSEEDAQKEVDKINEEANMSGVLDTSKPPTV
jgi:hypothetical protein